MDNSVEETVEETAANEEVELLIDNPYDDEETTAEEETPAVEEEQETEQEETSSDDRYTIKVGGEEVEVTIDEMRELAMKGADYTRKTMALAEYRKLIGALEEHGIKSVEDLQEFLSGGGSLEDLQQSEAKVSQTAPVDEVAQQILAQPDAEQFKGLLGTLPEEVKGVMAQDPRVLAMTYNAFHSGEWDKYGAETIRQYKLSGDFLTAAQRAKQIVDAAEGKTREKRKSASQPSRSYSFDDMAEELTDEEYLKMAAKFRNL